MKLSKKLYVFFILISLAIFGCSHLVVGETEYPNEKITKEAWQAFDDDKYDLAIQKADKCIDDYAPSALSMQKDLESSNTSHPDLSKLKKDEKEIIKKRGLLNDVATCYFIKGKSYEKKENIDKAINAYKHAMTYTYGCCYDPGYDGFWSVSKAAEERKNFLEATR